MSEERMTETLNSAHKPIRSFIRRQGRITLAQEKALEMLWPRYGLEPGQVLDPFALFGREAPVVFEIGFGNGDSLAEMAQASPGLLHVGVEVHKPGVGHLLLRLNEMELENVRIYCTDAIEVLTHQVADASLDRVQLFFPDPWPKTRHHKRRIVNPGFVSLLARKLKPGGIFHAATDWENYAEHMTAVLAESPLFRNTARESLYAPRPDYRPLTKFEGRGHRLGHGVWDLIYQRVS